MLLPPAAADSRNVRLTWFPLVPLLVACAAAAALAPQVFRHRTPPTPPVFAGSTSVYAVPLAGGKPRELLRLHGQWGFPVATPDGRALLLERPTLTRTSVWRVPLDASPRRLVRSQLRFTGQFGAAGPYDVTERETRPASTGWRLDLHVVRAGHIVWSRRMPFPAGAPAASADGSTVAMVRMHLLELWTPHGHRLLARDAEGPEPPLWSRDGRFLIYTSHLRTVALDVRTGRERTLTRGPYFEPALSPDGKTVYVLGLNDAVSIPK